MRVNLIVAWYDMWVGAYWDGSRRVLYVLPIPCVGLKISFDKPSPDPPASREQIPGRTMSKGA